MHAVTRIYSGTGAKELCDVIASKKDDVEKLLRGISGFRAYVILRTSDGCLSVTVCDSKAGTDESMRVAADWVKTNAGDLGISPPQTKEGEVILQMS